MSTAAPRTQVAARLISATQGLLASSGLAGCAARPIAEAAEASAAAIGYHFDGVEGLTRAAFEAALEDEATEQARQLGALAALTHHGAGDRRMFPAWYAALLWQDCHNRRQVRRIRRELFQHCDRVADLGPVASAWSESETGFWRQALAAFALDPDFAGPCIEARQGLGDVFAFGPGALSSVAFVLSAADHFARRAARIEVVESGWREALAAQGPDRGETLPEEGGRLSARRRILEAAVQLISEGGVRHLTIRRLAAASKTSPALALAHFGSREGVVRATFEHIHAHLVARLTEQARASATPATPEGVIETYRNAMLSPDGRIRAGVSAMDELIGFAASAADASDMAYDIIVSRGEFSYQALTSAWTPACAQPTRTDGLLLTLCGLAGLSALRATPLAHRLKRLEADAAHRLRLLRQPPLT
jgi:AcrR family transcriptional regulator